VGTGSVGLRDYVVLFEGNGAQDPMFLQIKQEMPSAYAQWLPAPSIPPRAARGGGQRAVQPISDLLLGWDFHRRASIPWCAQLNDHKGQHRTGEAAGGGLESLAQVAAELLAPGTRAVGRRLRKMGGYCAGA